MTKFTFSLLNNYKNNGQNIEQSIRYERTGKLFRADNVKHTDDADIDGYQVKGPRATLADGTTDITAYLVDDKATAFIVAPDMTGTAFILSREEYIAFTLANSTVTVTSDGRPCLRMRRGKAVRDWLDERAR